MAKQKQADVGKEQPASEHTEIVYRKSSAQGANEKTYSFVISEEQSAFIKTHRKTINFSDTFRKYLDSIIDTVSTEESKQSKEQ